MDFEKVLKLLMKDFEKKNINYALVGGFAMGALGIMKTTMDLDFLVEHSDLPKIRELMKKYSYKRVYNTENVSQYVSDTKIFGELDFLHAFREISISMLKRSKAISVFEGKLKIRVLIPEDIIGLKLQALANNPVRENKEYADIEMIAKYFGDKLDWDLIKEYFNLFQKESEYAKLRKRYGHFKR
ncbi:MAG: nucleotidyltransferase [Candidatus Omnitrophica bacterium]|nr:nucleotidyltransferase [Candidatus Omnitrophota bacterium]